MYFNSGYVARYSYGRVFPIIQPGSKQKTRTEIEPYGMDYFFSTVRTIFFSVEMLRISHTGLYLVNAVINE